MLTQVDFQCTECDLVAVSLNNFVICDFQYEDRRLFRVSHKVKIHSCMLEKSTTYCILIDKRQKIILQYDL
jgi:competence protein ComGF